MSNPKITAKNLTYNTTLPPFLARLQASNSSAALDGRHERPLARPRLKRDSIADTEDEPAYVDEITNETLDRDAVGKLLGTNDVKDHQGIRSTTRDASDGYGNRGDPDSGDEGTDRFGRRRRRDGAREGSKITETEIKEKPAKQTGNLPAQEKLAAIGASRKRKIVRAIGTDDGATTETPERGEDRKGTTGNSSSRAGGLNRIRGNGDGMLKVKKSKKIKLSFSDNDGET